MPDDQRISFDESAVERIFGRIEAAFSEMKKVYAELMSSRQRFGTSWSGDSSRLFEQRIESFDERLSGLNSKWRALEDRYEHARNCVTKLNEIDFGMQR